MKLLASLSMLVLFAPFLVVFGETSLETCSCWEGYRPAMVGEKAMCVGIRLMAIKPCNLPQAPMCVCNHIPEVTGITTDAAGTRCSKYLRGIEVEQWPCKNQDEWEAFKKELANKPMDY